MNSLSHKYFVLKKSLNCALKSKYVLIPFFIENNSQNYLEYVTAAKNLSIPRGGAGYVCRTSTKKRSSVTLWTRLPFQRANKVNTCSLQFNPLAKRDKLDYSCCSITKEKKDCMVIRPLLDLSRGFITAICKYEKLPVYPDQSNQSLHYSRNRIRKQIIPGIQLFFNPQVEEALFQLAERVSQEQKLISRVIYTTTK